MLRNEIIKTLKPHNETKLSPVFPSIAFTLLVQIPYGLQTDNIFVLLWKRHWPSGNLKGTLLVPQQYFQSLGFKHSTQCVAVLRKRAVQSHDSSVWIFYSAWLCKKKKKKRKGQFRKYVYAWKTHKATEIYCLEWVLVYWIHNTEFACVYIWGKFHVFIYHYFLSI